GNEDFNYIEVKSAVGYLQKAKFDAEFIPFQGNHVWPPNLQIEKALRLFTLKAMNKGKLSKNDSIISNFYYKDYSYYKGLVKNNSLLWAYNNLNKIIENYRFYIETDSLKEQRKSLGKESSYKLQLNNNFFVSAFEEQYRSEYLTFLKDDIEAANIQQVGFWDNELENIQNFSKNKGVEGKKMEIRLRSFTVVLAEEFSKQYNEAEHIDNL